MHRDSAQRRRCRSMRSPRRASLSCTPGSALRRKAGGAMPSIPRACPSITSARKPSPAKQTCAAKYDVIVFAPVGRASTLDIINGIPLWNNPMPWQKSELTPNLGAIDSTADIRPGLGYDGLAHLKKFVEQGGLLITCEDTAQFAIDTGLAPGVSVAPQETRAWSGRCSTRSSSRRDNPVAFGYGHGCSRHQRQRHGLQRQQYARRPRPWPVLMDPYAEAPDRPRQRRRQRRATGPKDRRTRAAGEAAAMGGEEAE